MVSVEPGDQTAEAGDADFFDGGLFRRIRHGYR
jgi:hypothetical protein